MRDNFTSKTKEILAKRVAWRCSFPGCGRITVGAGHKGNNTVINLGEACHIYAAAPLGPRYNESMSQEQRSSIDNGIWLCKHHAKIIDSDYYNYSAETLIQWKILAEKKAFNLLENLEKEVLYHIPTTFVAIGSNIVIDAIWRSANDGVWIFEIVSFILGDINDVINFNDNESVINKYIIIETQGDGRLISGNLNWEFLDNKYTVSLSTFEKSQRTTPYNLADISMGFEFENGDFKLVKGEDAAKQAIMIALSTNFGDMHHTPLFGSFFSYYYWRFKDDIVKLERLIKLEISRLISIPSQDRLNGDDSPPLNFINRILKIEIVSLELIDLQIPIKFKLEWGDGKCWESLIEIQIGEKNRFF
ncbi:hypothetical protein BOQ62_05615 [Chryseobacterium sp. CH21]|uniref:hypothetical protein n=1 Tax=Chryseobacterium sp. CH21 TaxID=713556 RepID=UPI00100C0DCE|nr:hypothetical protein [Chryseobacterium sp. CH21]RXM40449.1 hypothetical protein BOQ62_05615 [Chryseobacterium sp. CH21]